MAKLKTHKASAKRFKKTRTGKFMKKVAGQDHFNSRESGKVTRLKRTPKNMSSTVHRSLIDLLPN
jgi:large subunit ribosomal protein L35